MTVSAVPLHCIQVQHGRLSPSPRDCIVCKWVRPWRFKFYVGISSDSRVLLTGTLPTGCCVSTLHPCSSTLSVFANSFSGICPTPTPKYFCYLWPRFLRFPSSPKVVLRLSDGMLRFLELPDYPLGYKSPGL